MKCSGRISRYLMLLLVGAFLAPAWGGETWILLQECPNGKLYRVGQQRVMVLEGRPYEIGKAHGQLLAKDARALIQRILQFCMLSDLVREKNPTAGSLAKAYERLRPFIPERYQQEMKGLADGAGIPLRHVQLANVFPELFHCSGFALFGKATKDGRLLHGRILDYLSYLGIQCHAVTMVIRPTGRNAFVNVGYAGFIGSITGMNEKKIAIGQMGGRGAGQWDGEPMAFLFRRAMEDADTLKEAVNVFRRAKRTCEYYYVISDGKIPDARGLYCSPEKCLVLAPGETHEPELPDAVADGVVFSRPSGLKVLLKWIRAGYGRFTPAKALRLMDRPVAMSSNLQNVLFAPETLEMWVAQAIRAGSPNFQACHQPYQYYNFTRLLRHRGKTKEVKNAFVENN
ncbi:MAG: peptidase C45 [Phycisphaerae bacterium]|nr:peptidase C45 [Phycisphaerae bacterium]